MYLTFDNEKIYLYEDKELLKSVEIDKEGLKSLNSGEITSELSRLLESVSEDEEIVLENKNLVKALRDNYQFSVSQEFPNFAGDEVRREMSGNDEALKDLMYANLELVKEKIQRRSSKRDKMIMNAVEMINDMDETLNLYTERLREWYSLHFPELDEAIDDNESFIRLVSELGHRKNFEKDLIDELIEVSDGTSNWISEKKEGSLGAEVGEKDLQMIIEVSKRIKELRETRKELNNYIDDAMKDVAPNLREIAGSKIGAGLISLAGSLENLATSPSSTIQVLGAEKALFKHLRSGTSPPKHGIIYKHPLIQKNNRKVSGKIARALAGKITIAARIDYYSGEYKAEKLELELNERIEEIKKEI